VPVDKQETRDKDAPLEHAPAAGAGPGFTVLNEESADTRDSGQRAA
jgi:hypothetical protein